MLNIEKNRKVVHTVMKKYTGKSTEEDPFVFLNSKTREPIAAFNECLFEAILHASIVTDRTCVFLNGGLRYTLILGGVPDLTEGGVIQLAMLLANDIEFRSTAFNQRYEIHGNLYHYSLSHSLHGRR